jgi:prepilin-type N-terminal cleavage/methylation domain-containing protein
MKRSQSGFTLIELIVVIVLLGILGVTALGKFADLSTNAEDATAAGIATELTGASSINYANTLLGGTATPAINSTTGFDCANASVQALLTGDAIPTGYFSYPVTSGTDSTAAAANQTCSAPGDIIYCGMIKAAAAPTAAAQGTSATRGQIYSLYCTGP